MFNAMRCKPSSFTIRVRALTGRGTEHGVREDAPPFDAGTQIQKRLALEAEFVPFNKYPPGSNVFPVNKSVAFAAYLLCVTAARGVRLERVIRNVPASGRGVSSKEKARVGSCPLSPQCGARADITGSQSWANSRRRRRRTNRQLQAQQAPHV
jgi:hypothetical protein